MNKLTIIIPQYKEDTKKILPLFYSIASQKGIDFNDIKVLLVNDCSDVKIDDNFLRSFNFEINYILLDKNVGPGMARQFGIMLAESEYIMFCDADDMLYSPISLRLVFDGIKEKPNTDFFMFSFIQERRTNGTPVFQTKHKAITWLHGKVYRRQFLIDNKICFHPDLRLQEDLYFNMLVGYLSKKTIYYPTPIYLWQMNLDSLTRCDDNEMIYSGMPGYVKVGRMACEELRNRKIKGLGRQALQILHNAYFKTQTLKKERLKPYLHDMLYESGKLYKSFEAEIKRTSDNMKRKVYESERDNARKDGMSYENDTFKSYIKRATSIYAEEKDEKTN